MMPFECFAADKRMISGHKKGGSHEANHPFIFLIEIEVRLFCSESKALVSNNLQITLLLQPLTNTDFVTFRELELLINQAVVFEELVQTTLCNVLNHLLIEADAILYPVSI